jgi:exosortase
MPLLRDLGWALMLGVLVGVGPLSSSRFSVSVICGVLASLATFAYRRRYSRADSEPDVWSRPPLLMWACVPVFAFLFVGIGGWLSKEYTHGIWYNGHSLFVPVLMALLMERILRRDADRSSDASAWGLAVVAFGLGCVVIDCGIRSQYLTTFGLALCVPGVSLLLLGARRTRLLWLPLSLAFFMIPIPTELSKLLYLPQLIAHGVIAVIGVTDLSAIRDGTLLQVPAGGFDVTINCSGFSGIYAGYGLALILSAYNRSRAKVIALFAIPIVLAVAVNVPRAAVLLVGVNYFGQDWLYSYWHTASGIVAFWLSILPLALFADWQKLREGLA